jgi:hypothetical protein
VDLAGKLVKKPRPFLLAVKEGNELLLARDSGAIRNGDAAVRYEAAFDAPGCARKILETNGV